VTNRLTLMSHTLCPYVQRVAIVLTEKCIDFERRDIDLSNKPDWFLQISPLGKTPVLLVDNQPIFESTVICEYLDDIRLPRLHPEDAVLRAQHRAWMEFGSAILNLIAGFYSAINDRAMAGKLTDIASKFEQIEGALNEGLYFSRGGFCLVDTVFGPIFRYFDVFHTIADFQCFVNTPKVCAWRRNLAARDSVKTAVVGDYQKLLYSFLHRRNSALSALMAKPFDTKRMPPTF
jgi:glutathione S-transferase